MAIFLIIPTGDSSGIKNSLVSHKSSDAVEFYALPKDEFIVFYSGTCKEISDILGISDGSSGTAVVAKIDSYYGRASTDIWEWIKSRWDK
jgi:hypothetical protein